MPNQPHSTFRLQKKLNGIVPISGSYFGCSLSLLDDGSFIVGSRNGSPGNPIAAGSVYICERGQYDINLKSVFGGFGDRFGICTAKYLDTLAVGAYRETKAFPKGGRVHIFYKKNRKWVEKQILTPKDSSLRDYFGYQLDLINNTLVIGAYGKNGGGGEWLYLYF